MKEYSAKRVGSVLLTLVLPAALVIGVLVFAMQRSSLSASSRFGEKTGAELVARAQTAVQTVTDENWNSVSAIAAGLPDEFDSYTVSARIEWMQKLAAVSLGRPATYLYYSQTGECVGSDGSVKEMYYTSRPDISGVLAGSEAKAMYGPVYEDGEDDIATGTAGTNGERSGYAVYYTLPVHNSTGRIVGAFSLRRDAYQYSDALAGLNIGEGGYTYLVDSSSMVVAVSRNEVLPLVTGETSHAGLDDARAAGELAAIGGKSGTVELKDPDTGEKTVMAYAPVTELAEGTTSGWGVVTYLPKSSLESYISDAANLSGTTAKVVGLAIVLLILLAVFYFVWENLLARKSADDQQTKEKRDILDQTLRALAGTYDARNTPDRGHGYRVAAYAREIGKHLDLTPLEQQRLYFEAALHDIGMIAVPDEILRHQAEQKLSAEEVVKLREHVTVGGRILGKLTGLPGINVGAMYHQQFYDGNGYCSADAEPAKGENIPLEARIIAVADVYDELCGYGRSDIDTVLEKGKGSHFDPLLADIMIQLIRDGTIQRLNVQTEEAMRNNSAELAEV